MSNLKTTKSKEKVLKITTENLRNLVEEMIQYLPEIEMNKDKFRLIVDADPDASSFAAIYALSKKGVQFKNDSIVGTFYKLPRYGIDAPMYFTSDMLERFKEIVDTLKLYSETFNIPVITLHYIFALLHELGHITTKLNIPGYDAAMGEAIDTLTELLHTYQKRLKISREESAKVYRYRYDEIFADHFAWKYLFVILTKMDCSKYFELITETQFNKETKKYEEDKTNETDG